MLTNITRPLIMGSALLLLATGCQSTAQKTAPASDPVEDLLLVEPLTPRFNSENNLALLTSRLANADLSDQQRADMHYARGRLYDSVGLKALARYDFGLALKYQPNMSDAYNNLGIHFTQSMNFDEAYDAFDSAIELNPNQEYAYMNRGIALYYGGRPDLAVADMLEFKNRSPDDPYRILWTYLVERDVDPQGAMARLKDIRDTQFTDKNDVWSTQLLDLFLGRLSEHQFIQQLPNKVGRYQEMVDRLCEGYFYLGKLQQMKGNDAKASNYFKLALSTNHYEFVEHKYARVELIKIREKRREMLESTQ